MTKITLGRLREELQNGLEKGFTNKEIADALNERYGSEGGAKLTANDIRVYKEKVGLKGAKPKRKQFFEIIEDEQEDITDVEPEQETSEFAQHSMQSEASEDELPY